MGIASDLRQSVLQAAMRGVCSVKSVLKKKSW